MDYAEILAEARKHLAVARDGNQRWAVILTGDAPMVVYSGLTTRDAAEVALYITAHQIADNGKPYGPSEVPKEHFEAVGRVLKRLRDDGINDLVEYALRLHHREGGADPFLPKREAA